VGGVDGRHVEPHFGGRSRVGRGDAERSRALAWPAGGAVVSVAGASISDDPVTPPVDDAGVAPESVVRS